MRLPVEVQTNTVGSEPSNLRLSDARANTVRSFIIAQGVEANRLSAQGFGESRPVDTNKTRQGRANNRRVEFKIKEASSSLKQKDMEATEETMEVDKP